MAWFMNMKTGQKLTVAFSLCLTLTAIIGAISISRMSQMNGVADSLNKESVEGFRVMRDITDDIKQVRVYQLSEIARPDHAADFEAKITTKVDEVTNDLAEYEKGIFGNDEKSKFEALKSDWGQFIGKRAEFNDHIRKGDIKDASALCMGAMSTSFDSTIDQIDGLADWNTKRAQGLANEAETAFSSSRLTVIILLTVAIIIGIFMAMMVTKIITGNLSIVSGRLESLCNVCLTNLGKAVSALADGDLTAKIITGTQPIDVKTTDEFGALGVTVNTMIDRMKSTVATFEVSQTSLQQLISQARNSAEHIAVSADEVSAGNRDLSQRTEEQASSLEETAASMEEMTSTVKQNADNSRQANQLAAHARELAEKGGTVVNEAVGAMGEINQGSKKIAEIISVIDEIAFQTNLLALNASVEAARVGEQGRGFAVVAAEVRNLAGRSATAAKEIKSLVNDTVQKVQDGSDLVNQSGAQLGEIVSAVKKVADIIAEISAASIEQSAGIEQVNRAVMQMDQMTQQNAALVEEAASTSASMAHLAGDLRTVVSKFKLDQQYLISTPMAAPVAQRAAATGTYGGGRGVSKPRGASKAASKLHLVSHRDESAAPSTDQHDDFEEF